MKCVVTIGRLEPGEVLRGALRAEGVLFLDQGARNMDVLSL